MNKMSDRELMDRIFKEVKDPELRQQLLGLLSKKRTSESADKKLFKNIGVSPKAVSKNVTLFKRLTVVIGIFLFIIGCSAILFNTNSVSGVLPFLIIWTVMIPIICWIKYKFYSNIEYRKKPH